MCHMRLVGRASELHCNQVMPRCRHHIGAAFQAYTERAHAMADGPEQFDEAAAFTTRCKQRAFQRVWLRRGWQGQALP